VSTAEICVCDLSLALFLVKLNYCTGELARCSPLLCGDTCWRVVARPDFRELAGRSGVKSCLKVSRNLLIPTGLKLNLGRELSAAKKENNL